MDSGLGYPANAPSVSQGTAIFAQHCAACHGLAGQGDGPAAAQLMQQRTDPLPDFSMPDHVQHHSPAELFQVVTQGRLDRLMPPWADKLSEAERWSVVAYLYTLSIPPSRLDTAKALYAEQCAACHGETGQGDGPQARDLQPQDFTDQAYMAARNDTDLFTALTQHKVHLPKTLTDDERWAAVSYLRTLSFAAGGQAPMAAATASVANANKGAVSGRVANGTQGASVPGDLPILLRGYDNFSEVQTLTTTVHADGTFEFADVPYVPGRRFMLTTDYGDLTYTSDIFDFDSGAHVSGLALSIYDSTTDPTALRIERMHITFDFNMGAGQIAVGEMFLIANVSDKTFVSSSGPVIEVPLPAGATHLAVQDRREGVDYTRTADGLALNVPVRPGPSAAQFTFSFQLPYTGQLNFEQKVRYPLDVFNVLLPDVNVAIQGANLRDDGAQVIQGASFRAYSAGGVAANGTLAFQLSWQPGASLAVESPLAFDPWPLMLGLVMSGVALAGAGVWWYRRKPQLGDTPPPDFDNLAQAIADLDDDFAEGAIKRPDYERERARLKAMLVALAETRRGD
jgi:mono/diheme cytochrome c family protein